MVAAVEEVGMVAEGVAVEGVEDLQVLTPRQWVEGVAGNLLWSTTATIGLLLQRFPHKTSIFRQYPCIRP